ncbi:MAG TPA: SAM-dependent methyltransferase [Ilumatobacteraceae bacterium]|nr:SAM-dependent methyltransferase [Ilumatobacteraceae bacterium]
MSTTSREFFETMYRSVADPWSFATSEYEQERYARTLEFVPHGCFHNVFEPGCSIGELTAQLADHCDRVTATDIAETAVESARDRCRHLHNVDVHQGSLVDDLPAGPFDLVVFSEIGYYFAEPQLADIARRLAARIEASGQLLAVHWTGVSADHVLGGRRVHEILGDRLPMTHLLHEEHPWDDTDGFILDIWAKPPTNIRELR